MTVEIQTLTHFGHGKKERVARNISIDMEQVKFLPLLIICVQTAKGFIWNSSKTSISVCVGNTISLDWGYTLESGEIHQVTSWTKFNGTSGPVQLANDLGGFSPDPAYVGRLTSIENAGIKISNATSSDIGTYSVIVVLTLGHIYTMDAIVHVHEIANAPCIPTCDSSWKCQIPQACPVKNYIDAVWTVDGVKHTNEFKCSPNNYNKPYNVCAEGDAVTSCYRGPSLCHEEKRCIDGTGNDLGRTLSGILSGVGAFLVACSAILGVCCYRRLKAKKDKTENQAKKDKTENQDETPEQECVDLIAKKDKTENQDETPEQESVDLIDLISETTNSGAGNPVERSEDADEK